MKNIIYCEAGDRTVNKEYYCPEEPGCEACSLLKPANENTAAKKSQTKIDLGKLITLNRQEITGKLSALPDELRRLIKVRVSSRFVAAMRLIKTLIAKYEDRADKKQINGIENAFNKTIRSECLTKESYDRAMPGLPDVVSQCKMALEAEQLLQKSMRGNFQALDDVCKQYPIHAAGMLRVIAFELMRFERECDEFKGVNQYNYIEAVEKAKAGDETALLFLVNWNKYWMSVLFVSSYIQSHNKDTEFIAKISTAVGKQHGYLSKITNQEKNLDDYILTQIYFCLLSDPSPMLQNPRQYFASRNDCLTAIPRLKEPGVQKELINHVENLGIEIPEDSKHKENPNIYDDK